MTIKPAAPSETDSADPTGVSSPMGSCSAVTRRNVPKATAETAIQFLADTSRPVIAGSVTVTSSSPSLIWERSLPYDGTP
ncbi:hypothetical protein GCM10009560_21860 [Nonomuraea longicatena]|uniref:Uncharacterized protein n=1 Tax=Nonomuraea longicatena TaxID=83682 RepID=A0ABP3ZKN4_9ACTN